MGDEGAQEVRARVSVAAALPRRFPRRPVTGSSRHSGSVRSRRASAAPGLHLVTPVAPVIPPKAGKMPVHHEGACIAVEGGTV